MKALLGIILITLAVNTNVAAQEKQDPVTQAIESKEYVFKVRSIMPASGGVRQVNSSYDFTVNHDSLISYLPYFGRAYVAPIGRTTDPLNFTSTEFSYTIKEGKKGGWIIDIRPKNQQDIRSMSLNITKNGYGILYVNNQNRQNISYTGKVEPLKKGT